MGHPTTRPSDRLRTSRARLVLLPFLPHGWPTWQPIARRRENNGVGAVEVRGQEAGRVRSTSVNCQGTGSAIAVVIWPYGL